ncbi:DinB family protein [Motilibacter rhizosphaerae]|uniref:DinB family protein n=1 Tax=Motilibacter rhizosphaerae TaxID=598652 RepID=A0A4Q7NV06_9ACTN|nr:DinB family protein [Motilibacter rhizosphaerae]RZS90934.1 DinB family protein [Motilibacter rhizosphaerae]
MDLVRGELVALLDHAHDRLEQRLEGMTDDELRWTPTDDDRIGIAWRLQHLTRLFTEPRAWTWLGAEPPAPRGGPEQVTVASVRAALRAAFARWRDLVAEVDDLALPVGPAAGAYASATRLAFVLHVVDELVHHAAEAALLRDLYARQVRLAGCSCRPEAELTRYVRTCDHCDTEHSSPHCVHDQRQAPCPECDVVPVPQLG